MVAKFAVGPVSLDLQGQFALAGMKGPTAYWACILCEIKGEDCETVNGGRVR